MNTTLAFDVYGTMIDTNGVVSELQKCIGNNAKFFSDTWRSKQLEYSFRRSLMQNYENFAICTRQALDYTCLYHKVVLSEHKKSDLLNLYEVLPAFSDVKEGLTRLQQAGFRLFAFSNGTTAAQEVLLKNAGIRDLFLDVVSVDDIKTFKPSAGTYCHFLRKAGVQSSEAWMVSSNPFDVIGALSAGMKSAWVHRSKESIFDPWGIDPTITVSDLLELKDKIKE